MKLNLDNILVKPEACLNYLSNRQVCRLCVDSCPINAIYIEDQVPAINPSSCIDCGGCISSCPTLALDNSDKPYALVSNLIRQYPNSKITCNEMENYQKGIKVPCYLYLDVPLILQYTHKNESIKLYTGKCSTCSKAEFVSVERHVEKLQEELRQLHIPIVIQLDPTNIDNDQDQVINGLTRRELLKKFSIKNIRETVINKGEDIKGEKDGELTIKERTRFKRKLLNDFLLKSELTTEEYLPAGQFSNISISENCNGCKVCESICPTNAIIWHSDGSNSELQFNVQACITCQKCTLCPEKAISLNSITFGEYVEKNKRVFQRFELKKCYKCGEEFRTKSSTDICSICQTQVNKDSKRFFTHYLE